MQSFQTREPDMQFTGIYRVRNVYEILIFIGLTFAVTFFGYRYLVHQRFTQTAASTSGGQTPATVQRTQTTPEDRPLNASSNPARVASTAPTPTQNNEAPNPPEALPQVEPRPEQAESDPLLKQAIEARLSREYAVCMEKSGGITADMLECLSAETKIQDAALNATYKRLMGKLEPEGQATVRQAQRAWIKERDEQCDAAAAEYENGSMGPVAHASCYLMKEVERTIQLEMLEPR